MLHARFARCRLLGRHARRLSTTHVCVPPAGLLTLRMALDDAVLGQSELKDAFILALIAREHLYVEGPPGAAKTLLAESAAGLTGLRSFVYQLHRDTRVHELVESEQRYVRDLRVMQDVFGGEPGRNRLSLVVQPE